MKHRNWLRITESFMFVGSGVGTIAAIASQQVLYSAAPVSALLFLNLLNHRRLEQTAQAATDSAIAQLDQKFAGTITTLQQQVHALPSPLHLASLRKDLNNRRQEAVGDLDRRLQQLSDTINQPDVRSLPEAVLQLREQYTVLMHSLGNVRETLQRLNQPPSPTTTLEPELAQLKAELADLKRNLPTASQHQTLHRYRDLEDQIKQLHRRLNKLPAPFDGNFLKQDIESLIKVVGEMVTRRDLARVEAQLEQLSQKNEGFEQALGSQKTVTTILRKEMTMVAAKLGTWEKQLDAIALARPESVEALAATVSSLEQQVNQLPKSTDLVNLRAEVQHLINGHVGQLQHHLETVQEQTQVLEAQHRTLREWVHQLPQLLDATTVQAEVKQLAHRVEWAETNVLELQARQSGQREPATHAELVVEVQAEAIDTEPGRDRPLTTVKSSRSLLEAALDTAQARLIVVSPFPDATILDADLLQQFQAFLARRGCLDIGWGHLAAGGDRLEPRSIDRRRGIHPAQDDFLYKTLNCLTELKKQYPNQFRFKVMGTDEAFLVCDRAYAVLGADSMPTASAVFPTAAIGIRTTDPAIIQQLVERFDDPVLATTDVTAYFHRAATRYDLGDRQGAIADYTEVLRIDPNHDIAYNNRGLARYDLGEKGAAITDFEHALHHNPHNYIAAFNRGYVRSELGDKLGAIEDYTAAIHGNPDYAPAYFYRGLARTRMQNKLGAIQDYTEVIRLNPNDAGAYFYRGLASAKIGQRMEAIRDLRQAAQLFETQDDQANYEQALAALKKLQKTMVIANTSQPLLSHEA